MTGYRVKLVIDLPDCTDVTFWRVPTFDEALQLRKELHEDLDEACQAKVFIYADTRHGHIRVA